MGSSEAAGTQAPTYRLAWRIIGAGGALHPAMLTLSADFACGEAVRVFARRVEPEAFNAEFRLTAAGAARIYTTAVEIAAWDPLLSRWPRQVPTTLWGQGIQRETAAAGIRKDLREVLERAALAGLIGDDDALGLRRVADVIIADRLAA